jgi:uncharacterized DUF497 family protein
MKTVDYDFDYSEEKNQLLKETRGVSFEDIIEALSKKGLLDDIEHFNKQLYSRQRIFVVRCKSYVYAVPYIIDKRKKLIFLKTIYPSRALKSKYIKK